MNVLYMYSKTITTTIIIIIIIVVVVVPCKKLYDQ